jgi:hypothetical protein
MQVRNQAIIDAEKALQAAQEHRKTTIKEVQAACPHKDVGETDSGVEGESYRPIYGRVCLDCGIFAQTPYWMTKTNFGVLNNELAYKLTVKQYESLRK